MLCSNIDRYESIVPERKNNKPLTIAYRLSKEEQEEANKNYLDAQRGNSKIEVYEGSKKMDGSPKAASREALPRSPANFTKADAVQSITPPAAPFSTSPTPITPRYPVRRNKDLGTRGVTKRLNETEKKMRQDRTAAISLSKHAFNVFDFLGASLPAAKGKIKERELRGDSGEE